MFFFNQNENWLFETNGICNKWLNKLFNRDYLPEEAAVIIERAFKLYKL